MTVRFLLLRRIRDYVASEIENHSQQVSFWLLHVEGVAGEGVLPERPLRALFRYCVRSTGPRSGLLLDRAVNCPKDAERVLELAVAVAPEHISGRHDRGTTGVNRSLVPGIDIRHRQGHVEGRRLLPGMAVFGE